MQTKSCDSKNKQTQGTLVTSQTVPVKQTQLLAGSDDVVHRKKANVKAIDYVTVRLPVGIMGNKRTDYQRPHTYK